MINQLSSALGELSKGQAAESQPRIQSFETKDVAILIAGQKFVVGRSNAIKSIDCSYSVKGGGVCDIIWNNDNIAKIGAPCTVYVGLDVFWAGIITTSNSSKWTAEPLQKVLSEIYFYDIKYQTQPFEGTAEELLILAFEYARSQAKYLSIGEVKASKEMVSFDINSKTILEILEFIANQDVSAEYVYGVDNQYKLFFTFIATSRPTKVFSTSYAGDMTVTAETDNVVTVLSVFKNKEVKVFNTETQEYDSLYPLEFIGKVGIGIDPASGNNFVPVSNYYRFGHKEDRFEIDAPDMSVTTALEEAYRALRTYQVMQRFSIKEYNFKAEPLQVGRSVKIYSKSSMQISIYIDLASEGLVLPAKFDGSLFQVNETSINESVSTTTKTGCISVSALEAWTSQVALVDYLNEISIGFIASFSGQLQILSGSFSATFTVSPGVLIQYITIPLTKDSGFEKTSVELRATGNISVINLYANAHYGQTAYTGYIRSIKLAASKSGDFFSVEAQSFNSKPVLTFQKLSNQIRQTASLSLK